MYNIIYILKKSLVEFNTIQLKLNFYKKKQTNFIINLIEKKTTFLGLKKGVLIYKKAFYFNDLKQIYTFLMSALPPNQKSPYPSSVSRK